ncbi:MAG: GntR family transcriptional regulator [Pseudomonadota bacterium]
MQQIEVKTVAETLVDTLQDMVANSDLVPGERVNEVALSRALNVSRTPLREALNRLVAAGLIEARPRQGFWVPPLSADEFTAVYRVRPILDCAALEMAGLPSDETRKELRRLNHKFEQQTQLGRRIDADDAFHLAMVAGCNNPVLLGLIEDMMRRTRRYELAYFSSQTALSLVSGEHEAILAAFDAGDLPGAVEALRKNLTSGFQPLHDWLVGLSS